MRKRMWVEREWRERRGEKLDGIHKISFKKWGKKIVRSIKIEMTYLLLYFYIVNM